MISIYEKKYEREIENQAAIVYKEFTPDSFKNIKNRYDSPNKELMTPLEVIENYRNGTKVAIIRKKSIFVNFEPRIKRSTI
jgi:hypothetical protein